MGVFLDGACSKCLPRGQVTSTGRRNNWGSIDMDSIVACSFFQVMLDHLDRKMKKSQLHRLMCRIKMGIHLPTGWPTSLWRYCYPSVFYLLRWRSWVSNCWHALPGCFNGQTIFVGHYIRQYPTNPNRAVCITGHYPILF